MATEVTSGMVQRANRWAQGYADDGANSYDAMREASMHVAKDEFPAAPHHEQVATADAIMDRMKRPDPGRTENGDFDFSGGGL